MTMRDFVRGERNDGAEWVEASTDAIVSPFARPSDAIENGARVTDRGQLAALVEPGDVFDVFTPVGHDVAGRTALLGSPG